MTSGLPYVLARLWRYLSKIDITLSIDIVSTLFDYSHAPRTIVCTYWSRPKILLGYSLTPRISIKGDEKFIGEDCHIQSPPST